MTMHISVDVQCLCVCQCVSYSAGDNYDMSAVLCYLQTGFDQGRLQLTSHRLIWKDYKSQVL